MTTITWWHYQVSYNVETKSVTFHRKGNEGNEAESLIDYYEEVYPEKSWLEIVSIVLPEIKTIDHPEHIRFYSV